MAVVTIIGAGMMGSALAFPARENGNQVRLVGTHLDREIIETCVKTNRHPKFTRDFPEGVAFYQIEQVEEAIAGADMIIGGVSSFGVEWFGDEILPRIPEETPVLTVTKGLMDTPDGKLLTYPAIWKQKLQKLGKKLSLNAIGGPVPAMSWWPMTRRKWPSAAMIWKFWKSFGRSWPQATIM